METTENKKQIYLNDTQLNNLVQNLLNDYVDENISERAKNARLEMIKLADRFTAHFYDFNNELKAMKVSQQDIEARIPETIKMGLNKEKLRKIGFFLKVQVAEINKAMEILNKDLTRFLIPIDRMPENIKDKYLD
jgi:hypothetical protein